MCFRFLFKSCGERAGKKKKASLTEQKKCADLELVHALLRVSHLLQVATQWTLLGWVALVVLRARDGLHERRRAADQDDRVAFMLRAWHRLLDHLLVDEAAVARPPFRRRREAVVGGELAGELLCHGVELLTEQHVALRLVGVEQRDLRRVALGMQQVVDNLVHRRDARATGNHADLAVLAWLHIKRVPRTHGFDGVTNLHREEVVCHLGVRVALHHQVEMALIIRQVDGSVGPDHLMPLLISAAQRDAASDRKIQTSLLIGQREAEDLGVVRLILDADQLIRRELFMRKGRLVAPAPRFSL